MTATIIPADRSSDAADLVARVAELERTQRAEDVDGFVALFDAEAVWVTAGGRRLIGRDEIAAFTRTVLPGAFAQGTVRYDVQHVRFITADVALTAVTSEYLTAEGESLSPRQRGLPTYVWHRSGGRWLIAAGQNTVVPEQA